MLKRMHPTAERLVSTVVVLLDAKDPSKILVDEVLTKSGVSKGSLYHHFADFSDLIEAAMIVRFASTVDASIGAITRVVTTATSAQEVLAGLERVTDETQGPATAAYRAERIRSLALATTNERFRAALGVEQRRLTESVADIVREGQLKGWIRPHLDPQVVAVFIQAYTLGQIVDDIADIPMDAAAWNALVDDVARQIFVVDTSDLS
jgi:AcrR family transcriptional regulator